MTNMAFNNLFYDESYYPIFILGKKTYPVVTTYCSAINDIRAIYDSKILTESEKRIKLSQIRKIFLNPDSSNENTLISKLGKQFVVEKLSSSLFLDILDFYETNISFSNVKIPEEYVSFCRQSAAPVGRFIMAIANEDMSTYYSAEILAVLLKNIAMLNNIKNDLSIHNRCYISESCLQKSSIRQTDLSLSFTMPQVSKILKEYVTSVSQLQADAEALFKVIKNFKIRWRIGVILSLTNFMIEKYKKNDFLQQKQHITEYDRIKAECCGLIKAVYCRNNKKRLAI